MRNSGYYNASYRTLEVLKNMQPLPKYKIHCSLEQADILLSYTYQIQAAASLLASAVGLLGGSCSAAATFQLFIPPEKAAQW